MLSPFDIIKFSVGPPSPSQSVPRAHPPISQKDACFVDKKTFVHTQARILRVVEEDKCDLC